MDGNDLGGLIPSNDGIKRSAQCIRMSRKTQMIEPALREADCSPAVDRRRRGFDHIRNCGRPAERIDQLSGIKAHGNCMRYSQTRSKQKVCDIRDCDSRKEALDRCMLPMTVSDIKAELRHRNMSQRDLAQAIGMDENHLSKALAGKRQFRVEEMDAIRAELAPEPGDEARLPVRSIPLLGDVPAGSFQPQEERGGRRLVVSDPELPPRAYGLTIRGDSMDLIVPNGSTVIIDPDDRKLWPGFRYVVRSADGQTTFKEYQEGPARLVPCSSNPEHVEILLGSEPITIEGRVFSYNMRDAPRRSA